VSFLFADREEVLLSRCGDEASECMYGSTMVGGGELIMYEVQGAVTNVIGVHVSNFCTSSRFE
jgi:hypothetical protein